MTKAEKTLIDSIKRNWKYRACIEARQAIRWRLWELRQLRHAKVVYLSTFRFQQVGKSG